jgi:Xaa-Pro dipeptidase
MNVPGVGWASTFQLGKGQKKTLAIPMTLHAAARQKLTDSFADRGMHAGICLLKGGDERYQYDSDTELLFRQDSWFHYLFGVKEPNMYGALSLRDKKATLFIPRLPNDYEIWCGKIHPPSYFKEMYGVDDVFYVDELSSWIEKELANEGEGAQIHVLVGQNSDSGSWTQPANFEGMEKFREQQGIVCESVLFQLLAGARVTKSQYEIDAMWYSSVVASNAHVEVMRAAKAGMCEYDLEALFLYQIYKNGGCRRSAYMSICACGPNGAVLHYGHAAAPNDRVLQPTDMALLDMGADYHGYVSDITCSFPLSGKFTADQRAIYEGVVNAQRAVLAHMRPGHLWPDCHRLAEREILKALQAVGILRAGFSIDEMAAAGVGAVFLPHGLGHLIGCDTHDVGGYIAGTPTRPVEPGLNKLRTARVLEVGMVLTNEPGCYFIDILIDRALADPVQSRYIDPDVIARFRGFGGVRLEDDVVVTADGPVNLTTCPRTVAEVESVLSGGEWPPAVDEAPYLHRRWGKLAADGMSMEPILLTVSK